MDSGSDAGPPGQRHEALDTLDEVAAAVADDAPLPAGSAPEGGGEQDDGLSPRFAEPALDPPVQQTDSPGF
jgi:hypothetical protein